MENKPKKYAIVFFSNNAEIFYKSVNRHNSCAIIIDGDKCYVEKGSEFETPITDINLIREAEREDVTGIDIYDITNDSKVYIKRTMIDHTCCGDTHGQEISIVLGASEWSPNDLCEKFFEYSIEPIQYDTVVRKTDDGYEDLRNPAFSAKKGFSPEWLGVLSKLQSIEIDARSVSTSDKREDKEETLRYLMRQDVKLPNSDSINELITQKVQDYTDMLTIAVEMVLPTIMSGQNITEEYLNQFSPEIRVIFKTAIEIAEQERDSRAPSTTKSDEISHV